MSQKYERRPAEVEAIQVCIENLTELQELAKKHGFKIKVETKVFLNFYSFADDPDDPDDPDDDYKITRTVYDGNYLIIHPNQSPQSCIAADLERDYVLIPAVTKAKYGIAPYNFEQDTRSKAMTALSNQSRDLYWLGFYDNNAFESHKDYGYIHFISINYSQPSIMGQTKQLWRTEYFARDERGGWSDITSWLQEHPEQVEPDLIIP